MSLQVSVLIPRVNQTMNLVSVHKEDSLRDFLGYWDSNFEYRLLVRIHILFSYLLNDVWDEKEE